MSDRNEGYRAAGVDITAGYEAVRLMQPHIARTKTQGVSGDIGGFGGAFMLPSGMREPVLVSGTDGVGTKLKLAFLADRHDTVGIDCVAMCVNDIVCCGAKPLFFLDYIAMGKLTPARAAAIVSGIAEGCVLAGCALIGGETAEMPGFYPEQEYDLAGFAVGVAEKSALIGPDGVQSGDVIVALPSSGVHSNGFSLVRKTFDLERDAGKYADVLGRPLLDTLLTPTRIYVKAILALIDCVRVHSIAHITGGGFYENIPRSLPKRLTAEIVKSAVRIPPIFDLIREVGKLSEHDMFNTFNMGVGMTVTVSAADADRAVSALQAAGEDAYILGTVRQGEAGVRFV